MGKLHHRLIEAAAAVASAILAVATVAAPHWLETLTGLDVDRNSGDLEWAVTIALGAAAFLAALSARRRYLRRLAQRKARSSRPQSRGS
jgi:hypothetical protein